MNVAVVWPARIVTVEGTVTSVVSSESKFTTRLLPSVLPIFTDPAALKDPIADAVQSIASTKQSTAYSKYQEAQKNAETTYQKLVALTPNDATVQIQLGQAAQSAGDSKTAIAAYQKFLKLAPTDPLAPQVKQALKALQTTPAVSSTTTGR